MFLVDLLSGLLRPASCLACSRSSVSVFTGAAAHLVQARAPAQELRRFQLLALPDAGRFDAGVELNDRVRVDRGPKLELACAQRELLRRAGLARDFDPVRAVAVAHRGHLLVAQR